MNIKLFAFIVTLLLFLFGIYFLVENYQVCYACSTPLSANAAPDGLEKPYVLFALLNFTTAIFSVYLLTIRKFNTSAILSGVIAGLQVVAVGTIMVLSV
jgi:hypothetical protein